MHSAHAVRGKGRIGLRSTEGTGDPDEGDMCARAGRGHICMALCTCVCIFMLVCVYVQVCVHIGEGLLFQSAG